MAARTGKNRRSKTISTDNEDRGSTTILDTVLASLDADKAIDVTTIDLAGKTTVADTMVVATGTSQRHIGAMAEKLLERVKAADPGQDVIAEGLGESNWVLIDAGDVIVHLFRAETREFYQIEKLWSVAPPQDRAEIHRIAG